MATDNEKLAEELEPCPFCAASMRVRPQYFAHPTEGECVLRGAAFATERAGDWNLRSNPQQARPSEGEIAELVERLHEIAPASGRTIACNGRTTAEMNADIRNAAALISRYRASIRQRSHATSSATTESIPDDRPSEGEVRAMVERLREAARDRAQMERETPGAYARPPRQHIEWRAADLIDRLTQPTAAEKERATLVQNKRVNEAIQTALERGELEISGEGWLTQPTEPVACVACDDRPAPENNPCAVCGKTTVPTEPLSDEVVERIARAICTDRGYDPDYWIGETKVQWQCFIGSARAALSALSSQPGVGGHE